MAYRFAQVLTWTLLASAAAAVGSSAQNDDGRTIRDSFAGGTASLDWMAYAPFGDQAVEAVETDDAPDGDGGIAVLRHPGEGRAAISYVDGFEAEDTFEVEADVYCPRQAEDRTGSLTGIAFYLPSNDGESAATGQVDDGMVEDGGFYRLVCDYRFGDAGISLAYVGANIDRRPLESEYWPLLAREFGSGGSADWLTIGVKVERGGIEVDLDGEKLNERPIAAERVIADIANVDAGYAGIYAGHMSAGSAAEAQVDSFTFSKPSSDL
jgi:hypothetical protein